MRQRFGHPPAHENPRNPDYRDGLHQPGSLVKVLQVIADEGLVIEHLSALRRDQGRTLWEITLEMDEEANRSLYERIDQLPTARFVGKSDRVFNRHRGGKIRTVARLPINTLQILRDVYTPGVARVCLAIQKDPRLAHEYTALRNTVAIVTNGTAILGLGNIGALAGLPVMEGKAALFAELVDISGVPILLNESAPARVCERCWPSSPPSAPSSWRTSPPPNASRSSRRCAAAQQAGAARRPARHRGGDAGGAHQRGALLGRDLRASTVGQIGLGAAGTGIVRLLRAYGVKYMLGADRNAQAIERIESEGGEGVTLEQLMQRADIVIATTGVKGLIRPSVDPPRPDHPGPVQSGSGDRAAGGTRAGCRLRRRRQGHQQRAGLPGTVQRGTRGECAPLLGRHADGRRHDHCRARPGDELVPDPLDKHVHEQVAAAVRAAVH